MEAVGPKQHKHIHDLVDGTEDLQWDPCDDFLQTAIAISSGDAGASIVDDLDAFIAVPRPRHLIRLVSLEPSAERASQEAWIKEKLVLEALKNPEYEWRTVPGIAEETDLEPEIVAEVLSQLGGQVVKSSRFTTDGRALYTTRSRYDEFAPFWRKLLGAVKNQVD